MFAVVAAKFIITSPPPVKLTLLRVRVVPSQSHPSAVFDSGCPGCKSPRGSVVPYTLITGITERERERES